MTSSRLEMDRITNGHLNQRVGYMHTTVMRQPIEAALGGQTLEQWYQETPTGQSRRSREQHKR